ncbi:MAG: hypothetical protein HOP15_15565, partial [Planctomycetes bacterium]|nr:hypothetical protein [Planctomycetota bacterium]
MDAARYARLYELVDEARALDGERRAELVARVRGEDRVLGDELAALCAHIEAGPAAAGSPSGDARALLADEAIRVARERLEGLAPDPTAAG